MINCDKCINLITESIFVKDGYSYDQCSCLENWIPFEHEDCKDFDNGEE